jgi:hypothetical protein
MGGIEMKSTRVIAALGAAMVFFLGACAHQDAAMVGALIGHGMGTPLGVATVAVDETFATAEDIRAANPRYSGTSQRPSAPRSQRTAPSPPPRREPRGTRTHGYDPGMLASTTQPSNVRSMQYGVTEEAARFWR